jgi:antitoxin StbD
MEELLANLTVSMSEFKKNPSKTIRDAGSKPVAVLNHNKASFYIIEPQLYETLLEDLYDVRMKSLIEERRLRRNDAVIVDMDTF